jgi:hypothetical protein
MPAHVGFRVAGMAGFLCPFAEISIWNTARGTPALHIVERTALLLTLIRGKNGPFLVETG